MTCGTAVQFNLSTFKVSSIVYYTHNYYCRYGALLFVECSITAGDIFLVSCKIKYLFFKYVRHLFLYTDTMHIYITLENL